MKLSLAYATCFEVRFTKGWTAPTVRRSGLEYDHLLSARPRQTRLMTGDRVASVIHDGKLRYTSIVFTLHWGPRICKPQTANYAGVSENQARRRPAVGIRLVQDGLDVACVSVRYTTCIWLKNLHFGKCRKGREGYTVRTFFGMGMDRMGAWQLQRTRSSVSPAF